MKGSQIYEALRLARPGGKIWPLPDTPFGREVIKVLEEMAGEPKTNSEKVSNRLVVRKPVLSEEDLAVSPEGAEKESHFTCFRCQDGHTPLYCLNCAEDMRPKKKKKADFDERAQAIFNLYPNRQGGTAALKAVTESIAEDGFEMVLGRTSEYASAVARWPRHYRYSQNPDSKGRDMVPMASTWFNQRRYRDDPQTWSRVGSTPPPPPKQNLPEPAGWRGKFSESRYVLENIPWNRIDTTTQQYMIDHTPNQHTA